MAEDYVARVATAYKEREQVAEAALVEQQRVSALIAADDGKILAGIKSAVAGMAGSFNVTSGRQGMSVEDQGKTFLVKLAGFMPVTISIACTPETLVWSAKDNYDRHQRYDFKLSAKPGEPLMYVESQPGDTQYTQWYAPSEVADLIFSGAVAGIEPSI